MIPEKKSNDVVLELLLLLYRIRLRLRTIGVLIFLISFLLFKIYYIKYSSTVTFIIDNSEPSEIAASETEQFALSQLRELSNNRMYLILFSDEMAKRLDKEIHIGIHYGLNEEKPEYVNTILLCMHSNIDIEKGTSSTVRITARDSNKEFAASLANSIYTNLVEIDRRIVRSNLNYKKETYQLDIANLDSQNKKDVEQFLAELNKLQTTEKSVRDKPDEIFLLKRELYSLFIQYNSSSAELKKSALKFQVASAALADTTLQNLYLVNKAYPQSITGSYVRASLWSFVLALAGIFYYGLLLLFIQRMKTSFRELMYNGSSLAHLPVTAGVKKNYIKEEIKETSN